MSKAYSISKGGDIADHREDSGVTFSNKGGSRGFESGFATAEEDKSGGVGLDEGAGDGVADAGGAADDGDGFAGLGEFRAEGGDGGVGFRVVGLDSGWAEADGGQGGHFGGVWG